MPFWKNFFNKYISPVETEKHGHLQFYILKENQTKQNPATPTLPPKKAKTSKKNFPKYR